MIVSAKQNLQSKLSFCQLIQMEVQEGDEKFIRTNTVRDLQLIKRRIKASLPSFGGVVDRNLAVLHVDDF